MNPPLATERPELRTELSQRITALTLEIIVLDPVIGKLEQALQRRAELQRELYWLRTLEAHHDRIR